MRPNDSPTDATDPKHAVAVMLRLAQDPSMEGANAERVPLNHRDAALLAWLAVEGPTPRARLATLVWPESAPDSARNALRQRLFQLRKQAGTEVVAGSSTLALALGVGHDLQDADSVLGARPDEIGGEFGHWLAQQRDRRRLRVRQGLLDLAGMAEAAKDYADALAHAQELLVLEPLSEDAHRRVIRLHYLAGDRASALLAFDRCEQLLKDEVGAKPSAETLALLRTVETADRDGMQAAQAVQAVRVPAAVLRPPRLVGRDEQWQALSEAWDAGRCAIVLGEGGMGKTRLCTDFAAQRGRVLVAGARPGDARVVYASLTRLLRAVPRELIDALDASQRRELARVLPELGEAEPLTGETQRTRFFNAVSALIDSPKLDIDAVLFDDLHFADDASLELLHYVSAASTRRWIVGARGAEVSDSGRALLDGFDARGDAVRIPLAPLTEPQVAQLVASLDLAGVDAAALAPALLRHTGGNPLYLLEALKAWLASGGSAKGLPRLPAVRSVAGLIEQRIGRLSMQAVQLARCAAVAAPDFSIELASYVLGLRTLELADPWAELEAAQVLRDGAFAHDLIYESALASVPAAVARQLHAEIAAYLAARGGEPARVAAHWIEARNLAMALGALRDAAAAADRSLRKREQAQLLLQAADLAEQLGRQGEAFDLLHEAAQSWVVADRTRVDDDLLDRMLRLADTPARRQIAVLDRSRALLNRGEYPVAADLGEEAAKLARELGDPESEVEALCIAATAASHAGQNQRSVNLLRPGLPWILQHAGPAQQQSFFDDLAGCLSNADFPDEAQMYYQRAIDLALSTGNLFDAATVYGNLTATLKDVGDLQRAFDNLQQARRFAASFDDASGVTWQFDLMALALLRDLARYGDALRAGELACGSAVQHASVLSVVHSHMACLWLNLGQAARAGQSLAEAERLATAKSRRARLAQLHGRLLWSQERPAVERFADALAHAPLTGRTVLQSVIELDHALVMEPAPALAACEQVLVRCERLGYAGVALAARIRGTRCALAAGQVDRAVQLARESMSAPRNVLPDDLYRAELWLNAARAFEAAGESALARETAIAGRDWVQRTAAEQVPPEFRDSFLHRNRVNRELLALAARSAG